MTDSQPSKTIRMDAKSFIENIKLSQLIHEDRLNSLLKDLPPTDRGKQVARFLVQKGSLTKFQAERLLAGRTDGFVMGQYRILDQIGKGGMGHVFKAEHITMNRVVALKLLHSSLLKTERARQLFEREVRAAARLNHPNIVTAFDANQMGDRCYLVMEYVDGPNLLDLVKEKGQLPISQACDYIRQSAIGLNYAHDLGMVHRDIKPANLLVQQAPGKASSRSTIVKILDFGLARLHSPESGKSAEEQDSLIGKNTVMGTPDYLSPEQAKNLHLTDARSDLYSLGCTFYYILSGSVPFPGGTVLEKMVRQTRDMPDSLSKYRSDIPADIEGIVFKLMAKNPNDRFQTGNELATYLEKYTTSGSNSWVRLPLLQENTQIDWTESTGMEQSALLPSLDPWSGLDGNSSSSVEDATISNDNSNTQIPKKYNRKHNTKQKKGSMWGILIILLALIVTALALLGILVLVKMTTGQSIKESQLQNSVICWKVYSEPCLS